MEPAVCDQFSIFGFEAGEWPIEVVVSSKDAETWMAHLHAEMEERGWPNQRTVSAEVP